MSTENGKRALNGEEVWVEADQFVMEVPMIVNFTGGSCLVVDGEGKQIASHIKTGEIRLQAGQRCDIMKAYTVFKNI